MYGWSHSPMGGTAAQRSRGPYLGSPSESPKVPGKTCHKHMCLLRGKAGSVGRKSWCLGIREVDYGTWSYSRTGGWPLSPGSELSALPPLGDSTAIMTSPWRALHFISNACVRSFREELQFGAPSGKGVESPRTQLGSGAGSEIRWVNGP